IALVSLVSPYAADRASAAALHAADDLPFLEVFVDAPLEVCERRDPKGLFERARAGKLAGLTGIGAPYEAPASPDLALDARRAPHLLLPGRDPRPDPGSSRAVPDFQPRSRRGSASPGRVAHPPERQVLPHVPRRHPPRHGAGAAGAVPVRLGEDRQGAVALAGRARDPRRGHRRPPRLAARGGH